MISDRIESYLRRINENTKNRKLNWRPISEYSKYYNDSIYLNEYIIKAHKDELTEIESFFVKKEEAYLVLLSYHSKYSDKVELLGVFHKNAGVCEIPQYLTNSIFELRKNIIEYWKSKEAEYCVNVSDLFQFLDKFGF